MNDDSDFGPYAARLERIQSAEQARREILARDEGRRQQYEAAVLRYVNERMPLEPMGDAERESLARTLARTARRLLGDQADQSAESAPLWGRHGVTLALFRRERERQLRRLFVGQELNKRLHDLQRTRRGLRDPWDRYVEVIEAQLTDERLRQLLETSIDSLQALDGRAAEHEADNRALQLAAWYRGIPSVFGGGGATTVPASEWAGDHEHRSASPNQAEVAPNVDVAPRLQGDGRPFTIRGLDPDATRKRLHDVLSLNEQGFSSKQIGDKYNTPSQTVRTWLAEARKMRIRSEL